MWSPRLRLNMSVMVRVTDTAGTVDASSSLLPGCRHAELSHKLIASSARCRIAATCAKLTHDLCHACMNAQQQWIHKRTETCRRTTHQICYMQKNKQSVRWCWSLMHQLFGDHITRLLPPKAKSCSWMNPGCNSKPPLEVKLALFQFSSLHKLCTDKTSLPAW